MTLAILKERFSVCRLDCVCQVDMEKPFPFLSVRTRKCRWSARKNMYRTNV